MPKTAALTQPSPHLAPLVREHADALRPQWQAVVASAREFIPALLFFAVAYGDAYQDVKTKLGNEEVKRLNRTIGLTDAGASRLRDIAEAHKQLKPHVAVLPASVDAIHSIAVLATDDEKRFKRELHKGNITPALTVRDARELKPARRPAKRSASVPKRWSVVFTFDTREEAAQASAHLLLSDERVSVRVAEGALRDDIKQAVGMEEWERVSARLSR
jgi:hypothetical protein